MGAVAVLLSGTNLFGLWAPAPTLDVEVGQPVANADARTVRVQVANMGLRPLYIHRPGSRVPQPRTIIVERAVGPDAWQDVTFTARALEQPTTMGGVGDLGQVPIPIGPRGERMVVRYALKPGDYRVMLREEQPDRAPLVAAFTVAPVPPSEPATPAAPGTPTAGAAAPAPVDAAPPEDAPAPRTVAVEVQLLGVLASDGEGPRIRMVVTTPAGERARLSLQLDDAVLGPWSVREYNPQNQTVTLADRASLRVVGVGEHITLEVPRTALQELAPGAN